MIEKDWKNKISHRKEKEIIAKQVLKYVNDGDVIGFGSGSTSYLTAIEISKFIKENSIKVKAITTSSTMEKICKELNIETTTLEKDNIDWSFDGADEVDENSWLIKGLGGALLKEKINIKNSPRNFILIDKSKMVKKLGKKCPVPIEVKKKDIKKVTEELKKMDIKKIENRLAKDGKKYVTDNGNYIIDCWFNEIEEDLEERINQIDGVLDNGLFINYNINIILD